MDEFKPIPGYPNHEISRVGVVRRCKAGATRPAGWIVKPTPANTGHLRVKLTNNGVKKVLSVHRLVLIAWCREPLDGEVARHLDGHPSNNDVCNLAWGSQKENLADRRRHGRSYDGQRNPNARLDVEDVLAIRSEFTGKFGDYMKLSRKYGVSDSQVHQIIKRQSWVHL